MFVDIDECATGHDMCDHNCTNTPGSYVCTCYEGYYEDGHRCIGIVKWMNYNKFVSKPYPSFQRVILKTWVWPGDEAIIMHTHNYYCTVFRY